VVLIYECISELIIFITYVVVFREILRFVYFMFIHSLIIIFRSVCVCVLVCVSVCVCVCVCVCWCV